MEMEFSMSNIIKYDFQGNLYSFRLDGWFNATEAAARFGKRPANWLELPGTKSYVAALAKALGIKVGKSDFGLIRAKRGGSAPGTWMHPKLAVAFARWLSDDFGVWCDLQIDAIIRNGIRADGNVNLIPLFLRPDAAEWELRFPASYYHALAKVTNTRYTGHAGGTQWIYGRITDDWVYACILPDDVHAELKTRRSKSQKMHQWLTEGGREILDRQITRVTDAANSSTDLADFKARMAAFSGRRVQLGFVFPKAA
jgi:hypothetical protein